MASGFGTDCYKAISVTETTITICFYLLTLYIEVHFIPTLKFPQAYTRPSCVNTAVWLSPADVCITLYGSFNIAKSEWYFTFITIGNRKISKR
jgi:hypothetical protein